MSYKFKFYRIYIKKKKKKKVTQWVITLGTPKW